MAIIINGKTYRNLQEQVQKNMEDIEELQERVDYSYYTKEESDAKFQTKADMSDYYDKTESDAKFQTKIGMALYATQQQLNLSITATEARTDALLANKQNTLVSGTNIKTINGNSLVGSGNINIDTNYTAGYGIGINNDIIAIDQNIVALKSELNQFIKNNDTSYSAMFRGKGVWVKAEGAYTATSYGDGGIARSIPNQPGYTYILPNKSGTFALLDDIPVAVSGVNNGTNWTTITIGSDTYGIPTGGSGSIVAGTGIDITNGVVSVDNTVAMKTDIPTISGGTGINVSNNVVSVDSDTVVTKDSDGNVNGILQVAHLQSENWDEDDDNKANIYLTSGLRSATLSLNAGGEESSASINLDGSTAVGSEGWIAINGQTTFNTSNRINVSNGSTTNQIAYLSDIPSVPTQTKLYAHKISFNITFAGSNNITGIASIISTSSTQIITSTALTTAVRERGVVPASGKYTGSSSANNGRVIELTYGQGSYSQLCAVVVYDYEDIIDVVSIAANTITDTVTQI